MVSHLLGQESILHDSIFDALYCDEERFDGSEGCGFGSSERQIEIRGEPFSEYDLSWDDGELASLLSKERAEIGPPYDEIDTDGSLKMVRKAGIKWMLKVIGFYGFSAVTALLAVNYFDRFVTSACFQKDKPWMGQLAAVACLSIAAKVEETRVPVLVDLQVEDCEFFFEAKTIQRMELLILSTLRWKMNPATAISFIDHVARRFELMSNLHWEFLRRCESLILSIIDDGRLGHFLPSVIAASTMILVIREMEAHAALEYQNRLVNLLRTSREEIDDCNKLIKDAMNDLNHKPCQKLKLERLLRATSPSGVIDAYFSSESSVDSWAAVPSVSSSPDLLIKRSKTHDQHTR